MAEYLTVTCRLPASAEEPLAHAMQDWPVLGCQVEDAGGDVEVTVYLGAGATSAVPAVQEGLRRLGASDVETGPFAEHDWLSEYRRTVTPRALGQRLWVDPHPGSPTPPPEGRIHLLVEPRQAFGTGSHESTQLVLGVLEGLELEGRSVLDVGTGSGILAMAARALGAKRVVGCDIDIDAVFVARQTVAEQIRPLPVALFAGTTQAVRVWPPFDVVLANMLPAQFEPLLVDVRRALGPGGTLVLSGLMADQRAAVAGEVERCDFEPALVHELGEWVALVCRAV